MISGIITKGIGGFYYVDVGDIIIECRARGLFRFKSIKPMVGDYVDIEIEDETGQGFIINVKDRKSEMIRPEVANIEQVIVVIAARNPEINMLLLQKILVYAEYMGLNIIVCINKIDLDLKEEYKSVIEMLESVPYNTLKTSAIQKNGIDDLARFLANKISVFAGPSGVGKSSLLNAIIPDLRLKTGLLSDKTKRGTHTTRHTELIKLEFGGMVVDTPGFSSFDVVEIEADELKHCYPEFENYDNCRFLSCMHDKEPDCEVKTAVEKGYIHKDRYDSYIQILNELRKVRRY
ncbi:MAG: ribosome small subunit-dependent GTPase A [Firmicutes bacterium]|nr:ribosome small subunit-dependent GTPase A [Bacillota bacterium]